MSLGPDLEQLAGYVSTDLRRTDERTDDTETRRSTTCRRSGIEPDHRQAASAGRADADGWDRLNPASGGGCTNGLAGAMLQRACSGIIIGAPGSSAERCESEKFGGG